MCSGWRALAAGFALVLGSGGSARAFPWNQDMAGQPSVRPQAEERPAPEGTLPTAAPRRTRSREEAGKVLRNPVPPRPASLQRGERLYRIHCAPCHGLTGQGDGPVVEKYIDVPSLTTPRAKGYPDGFLYGTIRHGGPKMPSYREGLGERDRWDLVNFLRRLQQP